MGIYLGLYAYSIITSFLKYLKIKNFNIIYLLINILPLILIATFRANSVGIDLSKYYLKLYNADYSLLEILNQRMEVGYTILNWLIHQLTSDITLLLSIIACITYIGIFYTFSKCSNNIPVSVITFIGLYMYCTSFNAIRQYIAISFILLSWYYISERKNLLKAICVCMVGILFHKTAIVILPIILIYPYIKNFKIYKNIFITALILSIGFVETYSYILPFFKQYSLQYMTSKYSQPRAFTASIILPIIGACVLMITNYILYKNKENFDHKLAFYNIILLLYSCSWVASFKVYIFFRLVYYYEIFLCLSIPYIIEKYFKEKRYYLYGILICMMFVYLFLHLNKNTSGVGPYLLKI